MKVFLHRGRIIDEECLAGARIINQSAGDALCLVTDQKMKVWFSVIHQIWPGAGLPSSTGGLHLMQAVPWCLCLPSVEAGRIIYQKKEYLALMESMLYLCIFVIISSALMGSTWKEDCSLLQLWPVLSLFTCASHTAV